MKDLLKTLIVALVAASIMIAVAELATIMKLTEKEGLYLIGAIECMCIPLYVSLFSNKD